MARPARLELATPCLEGTQYKTLSAASGVAYRGTRHLSRPWTGPNLDWNGWAEPLGVAPSFATMDGVALPTLREPRFV